MGSVFSSTTVLLVTGLFMSVYNVSAQTNSGLPVALAKPNFYITTPQTGEQVQVVPTTPAQYNTQNSPPRTSPVTANANSRNASSSSKRSVRSQRPVSQSTSDQAAAQYAAYNAALNSQQNATYQSAPRQAQSAHANYYTNSEASRNQTGFAASGTQQSPVSVQTVNSSYVASSSADKKGLMNRLFHRHDSAAQQVVQVSNSVPAFKPSKLSGTTLAGTASWYGKDFDGDKTANGERYNMESMTAAHKTLPFGTMVKVRNERNGQECVVRINNRGPFIKGRILDVSKAAARRLDMIGSGVAKVTCQVVGRS